MVANNCQEVIKVLNFQFFSFLLLPNTALGAVSARADVDQPSQTAARQAVRAPSLMIWELKVEWAVGFQLANEMGLRKHGPP
jgi:hypothetical protein